MKRLDVLDLPEGARELVGECEITGRQTLFERSGRPVAILVSYDEYMALRETIALVNDAELRARIDAAEGQVQRGQMMLVEELLGE